MSVDYGDIKLRRSVTLLVVSALRKTLISNAISAPAIQVVQGKRLANWLQLGWVAMMSVGPDRRYVSALTGTKNTGFGWRVTINIC